MCQPNSLSVPVFGDLPNDDVVGFGGTLEGDAFRISRIAAWSLEDDILAVIEGEGCGLSGTYFHVREADVFGVLEVDALYRTDIQVFEGEVSYRAL